MFLTFSIAFTFRINAIAQDSCLAKGIFKTDSIGSLTESIYFPLSFEVASDSVNIFMSGQFKQPLFSFAVLKPDCLVQKTYITKKIVRYRVLANCNVKEDISFMKMHFINEFLDFIELEYKDNEKKFFHTANRGDFFRRQLKE